MDKCDERIELEAWLMPPPPGKNHPLLQPALDARSDKTKRKANSAIVETFLKEKRGMTGEEENWKSTRTKYLKHVAPIIVAESRRRTREAEKNNASESGPREPTKAVLSDRAQDIEKFLVSGGRFVNGRMEYDMTEEQKKFYDSVTGHYFNSKRYKAAKKDGKKVDEYDEKYVTRARLLLCSMDVSFSKEQQSLLVINIANKLGDYVQDIDTGCQLRYRCIQKLGKLKSERGIFTTDKQWWDSVNTKENNWGEGPGFIHSCKVEGNKAYLKWSEAVKAEALAVAEAARAANTPAEPPCVPPDPGQMEKRSKDVILKDLFDIASLFVDAYKEYTEQ